MGYKMQEVEAVIGMQGEVLVPIEGYSEIDEDEDENGKGQESWREDKWDYREGLKYLPEDIRTAVCAHIDSGKYGAVKLRHNLYRMAQHTEIVERALGRIQKTLSGERVATQPDEVARIKLKTFLDTQDDVTLARYRAKFMIDLAVDRDQLIATIVDAMLSVE